MTYLATLESSVVHSIAPHTAQACNQPALYLRSALGAQALTPMPHQKSRYGDARAACGMAPTSDVLFDKIGTLLCDSPTS